MLGNYRVVYQQQLLSEEVNKCIYFLSSCVVYLFLMAVICGKVVELIDSLKRRLLVWFALPLICVLSDRLSHDVKFQLGN